MKRASAITLAGTILAVTIASAALYASDGHADQPTITPTTSAVALLPQASDVPKPARTALQAAAYVHFQDLFGTAQTVVVPPVADFIARASKKPFGIFITPETSPIEDDQHTGYHTGVDIEFTDVAGDVPVYAIADGTIVLAKWVKGYGGVIVIRHVIDDVPLYVLYGHLNVASFGPAGQTHVSAGQQIAILGDDHSQQTDGVRKHIHFSVSTTDTLDLRGYVQTEQELAHWLNPMDLFSR